MEAVQVDSDPDYLSSEEDVEATAGQVVMAIQQQSEAVPISNSKKKNRTLRFMCFAGTQEVLVLLDLGSAGTFVSTKVASKIQHKQQPCDPLKFTTADGNIMIADRMIPQMQWQIQGQSFAHDTRVLPVKGYDMILGSDWLGKHSLMWIY